jgi:SAM-dependent methyltransferase
MVGCGASVDLRMTAPQIDYSYHYRKWHCDTPEHISNMVGFYRALLSPHLPKDLKTPVLDVGCGMGFAILALKQLGFHDACGIDSDPGQVASCQSKGLAVTQCPDSVEFLLGNPNRYGLILALDLLEHIPPGEHLRFTSAITTALKPCGFLVATTPNANSTFASRCRYLDWTHQTQFSEQSLDFLLHNAGLVDVQVIETEYTSRPRFWWLPGRQGRYWWAFRFFRTWRRLEAMSELGPVAGRRVPLSLNILARARKP